MWIRPGTVHRDSFQFNQSFFIVSVSTPRSAINRMVEQPIPLSLKPPTITSDQASEVHTLIANFFLLTEFT